MFSKQNLQVTDLVKLKALCLVVEVHLQLVPHYAAKYSTGSGGLLVTASTLSSDPFYQRTTFITLLSLSGKQQLSICSCFNNRSETDSVFIFCEILDSILPSLF